MDESSEKRRQFVTHGRPTKPDVEKLLAIVAAKGEGDLIAYALIEAAIGARREVDRERHRFWTVLGAFRRRLLMERGLHLITEPNIGLRLARGEEQIRAGLHISKLGFRRVRRGRDVVALTADDRLDAKLQQARDAIGAQFAMIQGTINAAKRRMLAELRPTPANPALPAPPDEKMG